HGRADHDVGESVGRHPRVGAADEVAVVRRWTGLVQAHPHAVVRIGIGEALLPLARQLIGDIVRNGGGITVHADRAAEDPYGEGVHVVFLAGGVVPPGPVRGRHPAGYRALPGARPYDRRAAAWTNPGRDLSVTIR